MKLISYSVHTLFRVSLGFSSILGSNRSLTGFGFSMESVSITVPGFSTTRHLPTVSDISTVSTVSGFLTTTDSLAS